MKFKDPNHFFFMLDHAWFRVDYITVLIFEFGEYLQDKGFEVARRMGTQTNSIMFIKIDKKKRYRISFWMNYFPFSKLRVHGDIFLEKLQRNFYSIRFDLDERKKIYKKLMFNIRTYLKDDL